MNPPDKQEPIRLSCQERREAVVRNAIAKGRFIVAKAMRMTREKYPEMAGDQ